MAKAKKKTGAAKTNPKKPDRNVLSWRDCALPTSINFRTQKHGEESVQATDIRVSDIELSKDETKTLLQEPYADRALWTAGGRGKPERPVFEHIDALKLDETIESSKVSIKVGGEEIKLGVCKLKSVTIQPMVGGVAKMSCLVQATPAIDEQLADLIGGMDGNARIHIDYEHNAEQLEAFDGEGAQKGAKTDGDNAEFEKAAKAQVDAFKNGTPRGEAPNADTH
jgi:hypothetical protein